MATAFFIAAGSGGSGGAADQLSRVGLQSAGAMLLSTNVLGMLLVVPSPPVGKIRCIAQSDVFPMQTFVGLIAADGSPVLAAPVGLFDWGGFYINADLLSTGLLAQPGLIGPPSRVVLEAGEALYVDITAFNAPCDRVLGTAEWFDMDAAAFVQVHLGVTDVDQVVIPAVPAGKCAVVSPAYLSNGQAASLGFVANNDSVPHTFVCELVVLGQAMQGSFGPLNPGDGTFMYPPLPYVSSIANIGPGGIVRVRMLEPVATVAPKLRASYQLINNP
jgi:hypothetical protein